MSTPRHLVPDPLVRPQRLLAESGDLAALVATPPAGVERRPGVLAVPGYTGSKEDFWHLLPLLARAGHPTVAIDLRGQYESGGPQEAAAYTIDVLGRDVSALLTDGEEQHVLAHSFGGLVCRDALIAGAPARSLTLLGSGPAAVGGGRAQLVELMRPLLAEGGVSAVWAAGEAVAAAAPDPAPVPSEVQQFLRSRFLATPAAALLEMGTELTTAPARVAELAGRGLPILVAHGEADDAWSPAEQRDMAERLGARYVVIPAAGHSPAVDAPQTTAAVLEEFWATVDQPTR
jgi:pimeloyl-ACP methyl ester carboxylesterase